MYAKYLNYQMMDKLMQQHEAYKALPAKVAQWVLKGLHQNWKSFFEQRKAYKQNPSKFTGRPKLPRYKHKTEGRNLLIYTLQALSGGQSKKGLQSIIKPVGLPITIQTKQDPTTIHQVRIVPRNGYYVVEVIYEKTPIQANVDPSFCVGIDLGVTNLSAIASNREGFISRLVNGRPLKAMNQWKAERDRVTKQMQRITNKRNRQVNHYLHRASKRIIDLLVKEGVGTIIIGKNPLWKQEVNMGRRTNQNFVQIPHARFI
jgi:putative transposase